MAFIPNGCHFSSAKNVRKIDENYISSLICKKFKMFLGKVATKKGPFSSLLLLNMRYAAKLFLLFEADFSDLIEYLSNEAAAASQLHHMQPFDYTLTPK